MDERKGLSYQDAGVDLEAADRAKDALKSLVASTRDEHTLSEMGLFGGLYAVPPGLASPVLVSSADGAGTKLKVAFLTGRHDTVGQCLVNHCVNDILVQGARPLFFMDYLASGEMDEGVVSEVVKGVALGCRENGCALLGGETAQMPDFYSPGEYDLAGFVVGVVERDRVIDGSSITASDVLVALPSSGLHTNGYTLARKIVFEAMGLGVDDTFPELNRSAGEVLLDVHRSYLSPLWPLLEKGSMKGLAHVTGGGLPDNLVRCLPEGCRAVVERGSWHVPAIFELIQDLGRVPDEDMYHTFNMGVGFVLVVPEAAGDQVASRLSAGGETAYRIGRIEKGERGVIIV